MSLGWTYGSGLKCKSRKENLSADKKSFIHQADAICKMSITMPQKCIKSSDFIIMTF